jgi:CubicO group peptidase (beta-lactamase class C family)
MNKHLLTVRQLTGVLSILFVFLAHAGAQQAPVPSGFITDWVILGPFPNPDENPDIVRPAAAPLSLQRDFLSTIGGESAAKITTATTVPWQNADGSEGEAKAQAVRTMVNGAVDFLPYFDVTDYHLLYALAEIQSAEAQEAVFFLGSDDGVRVFLNGEMIHENYIGRGYSPRQDTFTGMLKAGTNQVLVKVENRFGGWQLGVEVFGEAEAERLKEETRQRVNLARFQALELVPLSGFYVIPIGDFPKIDWQDPELVESLVGSFDFTVRWFDKDLKEVTRASAFGRYGMVAEGVLPDGTPFRRQMTFACGPIDTLDNFRYLEARVPFVTGISGLETWESNTRFVGEFAGMSFLQQLRRSEEGARLMALLLERELEPVSSPRFVDSPQVAHDDYHLRLKLELMKRGAQVRFLAPPRETPDDPAPVLRPGTPEEAGFKPGVVEALDAVLAEWAEASGEPHVTLVARNGVIVLHKPYGRLPNFQPITRNFRNNLASITKALSGVLFARFLDQGFIALDDPIGNVIPDFPTTGPKAPTWRMCFTHAAGSDGHWEWGGIHNPAFENVFLNGLPAYDVGRVHRYNGMSYNLAGKGMEYMTGASVVRLFHEGLYEPLGIPDVHMNVMGSSARLTALELAKVGQLLANRGRYGDKVFFSEETFESLLPRNLSEFYPSLDIEWGIGLTWMRVAKPGVSASAPLEERFILSPNTIGHGSATSCILHVDLDNGLVITQVRQTGGREYDKYLRQFLMVIRDHLADN